jgi:histidinol-phosphate aminotransferase
MSVKDLMKQHLQNVKPYIPGKPVEELRREKNIKGQIVKLASNENPYEPMDEIKQAILSEIDQLGRYPNSGSHYLSHELAEAHDVEPDQIFVGNGSNEILDLLVRAFVNPGEEAAYPFPSFIAYPLICQQAGVAEIKVPLKDYRLDLVALKESLTPATKMVFICNPNNPTGTYVTKNEVDEFLDGLPDNIIVVFDEAYFEYVTAEDYPDTKSILGKRENIIILRTFSKAFSLSGLRIGYSISHKDLATCLHMVRQPFNVNRIAQIAARAALKYRDNLKDRITENNQQRELIAEKLRILGFDVPQSQTNFLLAVPLEDKHEALVGKMMDKGVIVRSANPWGLGKEAFRVSIGTPEENSFFLEVLADILGK